MTENAKHSVNLMSNQEMLCTIITFEKNLFARVEYSAYNSVSKIYQNVFFTDFASLAPKFVVSLILRC